MTAQITFSFLSWWRVATGEGRSGSVDTICARDQDGFPFVPARQVRGLFREAVRDAEELGWVEDGSTVSLFGSRAMVDEDLGPDTRPGTLRFESARIGDVDRQTILSSGDTEILNGMFDIRRSTAMENGMAKDRSLRTDEVAIPLTLSAEVSALTGAPEDWEDILRAAAPLIRAAGQKRTRGFGRCAVAINSTEKKDAA